MQAAAITIAVVAQKLVKALLALVLLRALATFADSGPSWELGIGAVGLHLPDYRGSAESRNYVYPLPYIAYRSRALRIDRDEGARARFYEMGRVRLDLSLYATPPVHSEDNRARQNMPDLDPTVEVGPMLDIELMNFSERTRLDLRLPVRAVLATDLTHVHAAGWVFYPNLNLVSSPTPWKLTLQAGALFGTKKYHQYFYSVDPQFATTERAAYSAPGGYSGLVGLASLSRRFGKFWLGAFARYDALAGAAFEPSPLVTQSHSLMFGGGFAWIFAESETRQSSPQH